MKQTTRRRLVRGFFYALLVGAVALLALVADREAIKTNYFDMDVWAKMWPTVVTLGIKNTLKLTAMSFAGGLVLGLILALMRLSPIAPYRWIATAWIEFFRGLPALVVILFVAFAIPIAFQWRPPGGSTGAGVIALIAVSSAYLAETIRAGIQAVPKGQVEAARSLGMKPGPTMGFVVLPQAFRIVIPPLTNEFVLLLKDTSLLAFAGILVQDRELTTLARDFSSQYSNASPYVVIALAYLAVTLPLTQLVAYLERRQQKAR